MLLAQSLVAVTALVVSTFAAPAPSDIVLNPTNTDGGLLTPTLITGPTLTTRPIVPPIQSCCCCRTKLPTGPRVTLSPDVVAAEDAMAKLCAPIAYPANNKQLCLMVLCPDSQ